MTTLIKCTNPICNYPEPYDEYRAYCPKCSYSQGAGLLVKSCLEDNPEGCGKVFSFPNAPDDKGPTIWEMFKRKTIKEAKAVMKSLK